MIHGRKNLLQWFKNAGKPYFSIFRKNNTESGNTVFNNKDRENETMETAAAYLEQCLSLISSGDFFIFTCKEMGSSTSKGRSETLFTLSMSETATLPAVAAIGVVNPALDYETMMVKAGEIAETKFKQLMTEHELKTLQKQVGDLTKENKELQTNLQKPFNKLMQEVHPYIGSIAQQFGLKAAPGLQLPVSGITEDETLENNTESLTDTETDQMNNTVQAFCEALQARYPDKWISIIAKITNTLQTSPAKIDMALNFL
ncbi:MAG: hypothetical protein ABIQ31_05750 [Ferruginibacter sp.]